MRKTMGKKGRLTLREVLQGGGRDKTIVERDRWRLRGPLILGGRSGRLPRRKVRP